MMQPMNIKQKRCAWADSKNPLYADYHDQEWGVPVYDDRTQFEFLVLESAQAGLSWEVILNKREGYRKAFAEFDPEKVARFNQRSVERLVKDASIVRNRLKIQATISNARLFLDLQDSHGSFSEYIWQFVDGKPIQNKWKTQKQVPATTKASDALAKDMKQRGFKFFGSTIAYAHMQATGLINDHVVSCFRHQSLAKG